MSNSQGNPPRRVPAKRAQPRPPRGEGYAPDGTRLKKNFWLWRAFGAPKYRRPWDSRPALDTSESLLRRDEVQTVVSSPATPEEVRKAELKAQAEESVKAALEGLKAGTEAKMQALVAEFCKANDLWPHVVEDSLAIQMVTTYEMRAELSRLTVFKEGGWSFWFQSASSVAQPMTFGSAKHSFSSSSSRYSWRRGMSGRAAMHLYQGNGRDALSYQDAFEEFLHCLGQLKRYASLNG